MAEPLFKRILVKLSGEALLGGAEYGIDPAMLRRQADRLRSQRHGGRRRRPLRAARGDRRGRRGRIRQR